METIATLDDAARAPEHDGDSAQSPDAAAAVGRDRSSDAQANAPVVYELQHSPASQRPHPQEPQEEEDAVAPEELQSPDESPVTAVDTDTPLQQPTHSEADATNDDERTSEDDVVVVDPPANELTATSDRATTDAAAAPPAPMTELQRLHAAGTAAASKDPQRKRLDDELQCILCHDTLFKVRHLRSSCCCCCCSTSQRTPHSRVFSFVLVQPVTATCGHSFWCAHALSTHRRSPAHGLTQHLSLQPRVPLGLVSLARDRRGAVSDLPRRRHAPLCRLAIVHCVQRERDAVERHSGLSIAVSVAWYGRSHYLSLYLLTVAARASE